MNFPSKDIILASGRNVVSYVAGGVTVGVALHFFTADQGVSLSTAIGQIWQGMVNIYSGSATLISVGMAVWAGLRSTRKAQTASAASALPPNGIIKTTPELAQAIPDPRVVAAAPAPQGPAS